MSGELGEEKVCFKMLCVFLSAILYLNGDFDGGNFYFTELDAKTVTVSVPLIPLSGRQKPSKCNGQISQLIFLVASASLPKRGL